MKLYYRLQEQEFYKIILNEEGNIKWKKCDMIYPIKNEKGIDEILNNCVRITKIYKYLVYKNLVYEVKLIFDEIIGTKIGVNNVFIAIIGILLSSEIGDDILYNYAKDNNVFRIKVGSNIFRFYNYNNKFFANNIELKNCQNPVAVVRAATDEEVQSSERHIHNELKAYRLTREAYHDDIYADEKTYPTIIR